MQYTVTKTSFTPTIPRAQNPGFHTHIWDNIEIRISHTFIFMSVMVIRYITLTLELICFKSLTTSFNKSFCLEMAWVYESYSGVHALYTTNMHVTIIISVHWRHVLLVRWSTQIMAYRNNHDDSGVWDVFTYRRPNFKGGLTKLLLKVMVSIRDYSHCLRGCNH